MDPTYGNKDPGGSDVKESACNAGDLGFNLWVGKIPRRREWQPTPVFFPREFQGQRSLAGCSPWGHKESDTTEQLTHIHTQEIYRNDNKYPPLGSRGVAVLSHWLSLSLSPDTHLQTFCSASAPPACLSEDADTPRRNHAPLSHVIS